MLIHPSFVLRLFAARLGSVSLSITRLDDFFAIDPMSGEQESCEPRASCGRLRNPRDLLLPSGDHDYFVDFDRHSRIVCPRETAGDFAAERDWKQAATVVFGGHISGRVNSFLLFLRQLLHLFTISI